MKILFTTNVTGRPSTLLNAACLSKLNDLNGFKIDFFNKNYASYDVVLFMGYDPEIEAVKKINKKIKVGVIDPRPGFKVQPVGADFILANGIEMKDWYLQYTPNILNYYIYPILKSIQKKHTKKNKIILGYHGNKVHLKIMYPRITEAIKMLAKEHELEFWMMYNIENLGKLEDGLPLHKNIKTKHIQWSEENYEKYISKVDIGLVPNLIPVKVSEKFDNWIFFNPKPIYNKHSSDYIMRFKVSSNPGRIFVFAQYGIPVVADMFPSALQVIDDGINGFVCSSTHGWYQALKQLAESPDLRNSFATKMSTKFNAIASHETLNNNLINFISNLDLT